MTQYLKTLILVGLLISVEGIPAGAAQYYVRKKIERPAVETPVAPPLSQAVPVSPPMGACSEQEQKTAMDFKRRMDEMITDLSPQKQKPQLQSFIENPDNIRNIVNLYIKCSDFLAVQAQTSSAASRN